MSRERSVSVAAPVRASERQLASGQQRPAWPANALSDIPREECGILGLSTPNGDGVAQLAFFGLFALQHRGQEAAGLAVSDGRRVRVHKQPGLVSNVFTREALAPLVDQLVFFFQTRLLA